MNYSCVMLHISGEIISSKESKKRSMLYHQEKEGSYIFDGIKDVYGDCIR